MAVGDLSPFGLFLAAGPEDLRALKEGGWVALVLGAGEQELESGVMCSGRVVRVVDGSGGHRPGFGVAVYGVRGPDLSRMRALIARGVAALTTRLDLAFSGPPLSATGAIAADEAL